MEGRPVIFHSAARQCIREFPEEVRQRIGRALFLLQSGESLCMPYARPIPAVWPGASEIRVKGADGIYRVFYYLKSRAGILVLHAFKKRSQQTPLLDIQLARKRLKEMLHAAKE